MANATMEMTDCWSVAQVWRYSPENSILQREEARMNRALMRRYFLVEKTKDADIIGIVAGTLGVCAFLLLETNKSLRMIISRPLKMLLLLLWSSQVFTDHRSHETPDQRCRQEVLHIRCGQAQPSKTGQL